MIKSVFYQKNNSAGFTLVEILVVMGLFSAVMVIAAGSLLMTQAVNTKLQETQSILDNVNLSMDIMSREIRYGSAFHCDIATFSGPGTLNQVASSTLRRDCSFADQGGTMLIFRPYQSSTSTDRVAYYLKGGIIFKDEYIGGATTTYQVTADNVTINSLAFYVHGAYSASSTAMQNASNTIDYTQPLITLTIAGETKPAKTYYASVVGEGTKNIRAVRFIVETSISARELDI
jgi:prepilin-type N-terminal cleavage/methylation domain-containing protein